MGGNRGMEEFRVSEPKTTGKSPENRERSEEREKNEKGRERKNRINNFYFPGKEN